MTMKLVSSAYGKINLYLDVLSRMENGYHNVDSIMQSVSLCDTIFLEITDIEGENIIEILTDTEKIPNDKTNLVYKCAERLLNLTKTNGKRCTFKIEKNIPIAAGMAGGSSDGAIAMKLLNEALGKPLTLEEMCTLGAKIGADIPFCLVGGTCHCQGIGDKLTRLEPFSDIYMVCAIDNSNVSTPVAFAMLDEKYGTEPEAYGKIDEMIEAIKSKNTRAVASLLFNKFEDVIVPKNENVQLIKSILLKNGALGALMSGSGPSVFGIFDNEKSQMMAYEELKNCSIRAFLCKTI